MSRGRVILLEDDPALKGVLQEALASEQLEVLMCDSYEALRSAAATRQADIALADYWGSAHQALDESARDEVQELGQLLPVILLTGRSWAVNLTPESLGLRAIVRKPFDLNELLEIVEQVLQSTRPPPSAS
jgi:DNA-binding response OmpR family regulator